MSDSIAIVIEDEPDILEIISYNLWREGLTVKGYEKGDQGLEAILATVPKVVLLDLMLPGIDGLEICRRIRQDPRTSGVPIIMVSAKGEESDIVLGLGMGADDYVVKPFSPRELVARVKATLRRGTHDTQGPKKECIEHEGLKIDVGRHQVSIDDEDRSFTATEFRLLYFLASHPGRAFSREQIMQHVIGDGAIVVDRNIDVHVRSVRKKLGPYRNLVETLRGVGYRFFEIDS